MKGDQLVTYAIASADRFEPIPELDVDKVEVAKLTCCGFFRRKEKKKKVAQNQLGRQNEQGHTIPGGKWNPPIDGVELRFDSSLLEDDDDDNPS